MRKKHSKAIKITFIAGVVVIVGLSVRGCVIDRSKSKENADKEATPVDTTYEANDYADETGALDTTHDVNGYTADDSIVEVVPSDEIVTVYGHTTPVDESYNQAFARNLEDENRYNRTSGLILRVCNGDGLTDSECEYLFSSIAILNQSNMAEVEKLIDGGRMSGDEYNLSWENMFLGNSPDYEVLQFFTNGRNAFVHNAYNQNRNNTKKEVKDYLDCIFDFIYNGLAFDVNGYSIYFDDLSRPAQLIIVDLADKVIETDKNYVIYLNDRGELSREESLEMINQFDNEMMNNIQNHIFYTNNRGELFVVYLPDSSKGVKSL